MFINYANDLEAEILFIICTQTRFAFDLHPKLLSALFSQRDLIHINMINPVLQPNVLVQIPAKKYMPL